MHFSRVLLFIIPIAIASFVYAAANFKEANNEKAALQEVLAISLLFASMEYLLKVPAIHFIKGRISPLTIQLIWIFATFISVILFQKFYLEKTINMHSIIIGVLISILIGLELYLTA